MQSDSGGGAYLLAAHSVGCEGGKRRDITPPDMPHGQPIDPGEQRVFVRHAGTEAEFERFRAPEFSQVFYYPLPVTIQDLWRPPEPDYWEPT